MANFEYPKTMRHPSHSPAVIGERYISGHGKVSYGQGSPERYPDTHVNNIDQEEEMRAKGYLQYGESQPLPADWQEYPKFMRHPEHVEGTPDEIQASRASPDAPLVTFVVKGIKGQFPDIIVKDAEEEKRCIEKGYVPPKLDPQAVIEERACPYDPYRVFHEYPKWVDGKIVQDPRLIIGGIQQYPKWVHGPDGDVIVDTPEEEAELMGHVME